MYPTVNDLSDWLRRNGYRTLRRLIAAALCCFLVLGSAFTAVALSDTQQLVVDSWRLVNQGFWNPEQLDAVRWRRQRQKAMERSIESSDDAYAAIESMLAQLGDPYTAASSSGLHGAEKQHQRQPQRCGLATRAQ